MEYYEPHEMKDVEAKQAFERWHADQVARDVQFDFQREMEGYCKSDVALLQAGCEAFVDQFSPKARWDTLRRGRPRQTTEARELHQQAGVPEGPCGVEELQKFQEALGDRYQLLVMCRAKPFVLI